MTVGYYAPPRTARTGVADYAWTLFEELRKHGNIIACQPGESHTGIPLYHLGNNQLHAEIYAKAIAEPGVALLHDAVLHHFFLGTLSEQDYLREWVYNYGEWRRELGQELWRHRASSGADARYFHFPMLRRIAERSRLILVHNAGAAAIAAAHGAKRIAIIPHFVEPGNPPGTLDQLEFRESLGIPPAATLFGIFGYLRETKRILPCLRAFRRLHEIRPNTALLLAGECVSRELERLLAFEAKHPAIYRIGHLPENQFLTAAASIHCCLNLRYPAAGETSGIAVRMMGLEKPVILTESAENSDFPAGSCFPAVSGVAEEAELFDYMGLVSDFPRLGREVGRQAARYIRERHSLRFAATKIWEALCNQTCSSAS